jgi:hypothetical protein
MIERALPMVGDREWGRLIESLHRDDEADRARIELLLKQEFDQAWSHYRQLETARSQHVGFLFAALFALVPVLKAVLDIPYLGDHRFPVATLVGATYAALALFVLFVVRRNNAILAHYEYVMRQVRRVFYGARYDEIGFLLDPRLHPSVVSQPFRISRATERLCLCAAVGVPAGMVILSFAAAFTEEIGWPKYVSLAGAIVTAGVTTAVLWGKSRCTARTLGDGSAELTTEVERPGSGYGDCGSSASPV